MASPVSKNWRAQLGEDIDDLDYVKTLGLPESLVGDPDINKHILNAVHKENVAGYIKQGYSENDAMKMADKQKHKAIKMAKQHGLKL